MHPLNYVFMVFGFILAIVGIAIFLKMGTQGESSIRMLGFEFKLGGSSLVIFVMGVVLFSIPVIHPIVINGEIKNHPPAKVTQRTVASAIKEAKRLESDDPNRHRLEVLIAEAICNSTDKNTCHETTKDTSINRLEAIARERNLMAIPVQGELYDGR